MHVVVRRIVGDLVLSASSRSGHAACRPTANGAGAPSGQDGQAVGAEAVFG
jgi:hypothetical protein